MPPELAGRSHLVYFLEPLGSDPRRFGLRAGAQLDTSAGVGEETVLLLDRWGSLANALSSAAMPQYGSEPASPLPAALPIRAGTYRDRDVFVWANATDLHLVADISPELAHERVAPVSGLAGKLLEQLARERRLRTQDQGHRLARPGPPAQPKLSWELVGDGVAKGHIELARKNACVLDCWPRLFWSPDTREIGLIELPSSRPWRDLFFAPTGTYLDALQERYAALGNEAAGLPKPPAFTVRRLGLVAPKVRLRVRCVPNYWSDSKEPTLVANLEFDFGLGKVALGPDGKGQGWRGSQKTTFRFDPEFAQACGATLAKLGFQARHLRPDPGAVDWRLGPAVESGGDDRGEGWHWLEFQAKGGAGKLAQAGIELSFDDSFEYRLVGAQDWDLKVRNDAASGAFELLFHSGDASVVQILEAIKDLTRIDEFREGMMGRRDVGPDEYWFGKIRKGPYVLIRTLRARQMAALLGEIARHGSRKGRLALGRFDGARFLSMRAQPGLTVDIPEDFLELPRRLLNAKLEIPRGMDRRLLALLLDYQRYNVAFLYSRRQARTGVLLCDPMGAGKTLTVLALLSLLKARGELKGPTLVSAPVTAILQWLQEVHKHPVGLSIVELAGSPAERAAKLGARSRPDIFVCSHDILVNDFESIARIAWDTVVLDEAHHFRNHKTQRWQCARSLHPYHWIAVTGSPIHNATSDLWAISDIAVQGLWPSKAFFDARYRSGKKGTREMRSSLETSIQNRERPAQDAPIDPAQLDDADARSARALGAVCSLFLLRTDRRVVQAAMPELRQQIEPIRLSQKEADCYEIARLRADKELRKILGANEDQSASILDLAAIMQMREVCCDTRLVFPELGDLGSSKIQAIVERVDALWAEGRKVVIATNFLRFLRLIDEALRKARFKTACIHGQIRGAAARARQIERFAQADVAAMLITTGAGGESIDLVQADTILITDPWWNPQTEAQAIARLYRMGQRHATLALRLLAKGSIEEGIYRLSQRKLQEASAVLSASSIAAGRLTLGELRELLQPLHSDSEPLAEKHS